PPKLCENVQRQELGQPLYELLQPALQEAVGSLDSPRYHRFAHIVNTYACPSGSEGDLTQKTTFAAMARARDFAAGRADVDFVSVHEAQDSASVPDLFRKAAA